VSEETHHKVAVEYKATDHASPVAHQIAHAYSHAGHAVEGVKEKFREFRHESLAMAAGVFGVGVFGIGALIEKGGEAIREFGMTQKMIASSLTTVLQWPKAMEPVERFTRSMKLAKGVTEELDETAGRFGMGLQDLGAAYKTIAISAAPLKLTQEQLLDLTVKSAAAAKQFGIDGSTAADQIGRTMVTKTIRASGDLGKFLYQNLGNKLKGLSNAQVFERMNKTLGQSVGIAEQMGQGMAGSVARIQLRVQELFRTLGGPLFQAIAKSLDGVAKRMGAMGADGKTLLETYAHRLVEGFEKLKSAGSFIVDHWKTIALIIAGIKLPAAMSTMAGLLGAGAGGVGGIFGAFKNLGSAFAGVSGGGLGGIAGLIGALGPATAAVAGLAGAAYLAITALKGMYDEWQNRKQQAAGLSQFFKEIGEVNKTQNLIRKHEAQLSASQVEYMRTKQSEHAGLAAKVLEQKGLLENGQLNMEKFNGLMASMSDDVRDQFSKMIGNLGQGGNALSSGMLGAAAAEIFNRNYRVSSSVADGASDANRRTGGNVQIFNGGITINQKFEDVDPERVFIRFKDDLESYAGRRTSSALSPVFGD